MANYDVEIAGSSTFEAVNNEIRTEEAGASEFLKSAVTPRQGRITNIVTFKELPAGTRPKELTIVAQGGTQPKGTQEVWNGTMIISDTNTAVVAFRRT